MDCQLGENVLAPSDLLVEVLTPGCTVRAFTVEEVTTGGGLEKLLGGMGLGPGVGVGLGAGAPAGSDGLGRAVDSVATIKVGEMVCTEVEVRTAGHGPLRVRVRVRPVCMGPLCMHPLAHPLGSGAVCCAPPPRLWV
jgi:hypothetical protein